MTRAPAPLAFVAAEVRTSYTPALVSDPAVAVLAAALPALPVPQREQRHALILNGAPMGTPEVAVRLMTRDATTSLTITATTLTLETTAYEGVEAFTALLLECLRAVASVAEPRAVERVGLRYVNELRVGEPVARIEAWDSYVCPEALGPALGIGAALRAAGRSEAAASALQTVVAFELGDGCALTARFNPLSGPAVIGSNPLRRPQVPADGPFFVVDLDAYWPSPVAPDVMMGELFDPTALLNIVTALHAPIEATFLWATTEKFRKDAL